MHDAGVPHPSAAPADGGMPAAGSPGLERWPEAARAAAGGRGLDAWRILRKLRKQTLHQGERRQIDEILASRRRFVEPTPKPPGLGRINGVGAGMYGRSDFDPADGTYFKTRCLSFLWVPILPVDTWLVTDAPDGGWYFHGKAPLGAATLRLRLAAAIAAVAGAAAIAAMIAFRSTRDTVTLVNALPLPALVSIDGGPPLTLQVNDRRDVDLSAGPHRFRCTVGGRVVDDADHTVDGSADLTVYNVAGAAPVVIEHLPYTSQSFPAGEGPESRIDVLAGSVWSVARDVEHVYRQAPASVSSSSRERAKTTWLRRADVRPGGWKESLALLAEDGGSRVPALAEALALAVPGDDEITSAALRILQSARSEADFESFLVRLEEARRESPR